MYNTGLIITAEDEDQELTLSNSKMKLCILASNARKKTLRVVFNNIISNANQLPYFHVVHLRFSKLNKLELARQIHFLGNDETLFTRMALVIVELKDDGFTNYKDIALMLSERSKHKMNLDFFLVCAILNTQNECIILQSDLASLNQSVKDYYGCLSYTGKFKEEPIHTLEPKLY